MTTIENMDTKDIIKYLVKERKLTPFDITEENKKEAFTFPTGTILFYDEQMNLEVK